MDVGIERHRVQHDTIETSNDTQGIPRLCLALSLNPWIPIVEKQNVASWGKFLPASALPHPPIQKLQRLWEALEDFQRSNRMPKLVWVEEAEAGCIGTRCHHQPFLGAEGGKLSSVATRLLVKETAVQQTPSQASKDGSETPKTTSFFSFKLITQVLFYISPVIIENTSAACPPKIPIFKFSALLLWKFKPLSLLW